VGISLIGDIVVVPFPFSNLQGSKRRPALVLAESGNNDLVLCQITSQKVKDTFAVPITPSDTNGVLFVDSNIRPNKLFTIEKSVILYKISTLSIDKLKSVQAKLLDLFGLNIREC
jgi:mRNA interferase MazF